MKIKYLLSEDIRSHIQEFNNFISNNFPEFLSEENPNIILTTGGDGSMLLALCKYGNSNIPILGRSAGTVNFINSRFPNDFEILSKLKNDKIKLDILEVMTIEIEYNGEIFNAVNDIVIGNNIMDWQKFSISTEDKFFQDFKFNGMGICISTPIGSTAFNLNNNGKILRLNNQHGNPTENWSITNIVSDAEINEIIYSQEIKIDILSPRCCCKCYIDGSTNTFELKENSTLFIRPGKLFKIAYLDINEVKKRRIELAHRKRV